MEMKTQKFLQLTGISVAAVAAMGGAAMAAKSGQVFGNLLTPAGITTEVLGKGQGFDLGKQTVAAQIRDDIAFTDAKGLTLYTSANDPVGKSLCVDECTKTWIPAVAEKNDKGFGDWSLITRTDGSKQWAYKGKALYHFVKDVDPGSLWGNSPARFGGRRKNGAGEYVGGGFRGGGARNAAPDLKPVEGWAPALAYPVAGLDTPAGITIKEVPDATGLALVDYRNRTLYALDGDVKREKKLDSSWVPAAAAQLAEPKGDFSLIQRDDGIKQWAYKGKALFSSSSDLAPGDANGIGVDKKMQPATIFAYYMPAGTSVHNTPGQGRILATASGITLYKRDGVVHQSGGGHSLRRGHPNRPAVGRDIGVNARCDAECMKVWHPYKAPADARPQGFWNIALREDGSKQWTYQGYALWTYDGDKKPNDMNGNDDFVYAYAAPPGVEKDTVKDLDVGTPMDGASALHWSIVIP
jgi:predicted lipoprotein with Yx(FWY)xxD motif